MRLCYTFLLALYGSLSTACGDQQLLEFPETSVQCADTFHGAIPLEAPWRSAPRFHAAVGDHDDRDGDFGRLKMESPYEATGHVRYQLNKDGTEGVLDLEGGSVGYRGGFQIESSYDDDSAITFASLSHWCADGMYIAMAKSDVGAITLFGHFRTAEDSEDWYRSSPRGPNSTTTLQVLELAAYDCEYKSGEEETWHAEHCNLLASGTIYRRR